MVNKLTDILLIIWSILAIVAFFGLIFDWTGLCYLIVMYIYAVLNISSALFVLLPQTLSDLFKRNR